MPNPRTTSSIFKLSPREYLSHSPYKEWLSLVKSEEKFIELFYLFDNIPSHWIEWVDNRIKLRFKRGTTLKNPLNYRIATLLNGIISLQEGKFICDVLENALRQVFAHFALKEKISYADIEHVTPEFNTTFSVYTQSPKKHIDKIDIISSGFISYLTFYQLTETIARNWIKTESSNTCIQGFRYYFWRNTACRDLNLFQQNMKNVRMLRNSIAHSKKLVSHEELKKLLEISSIWLDPLNVNLTRKVNHYRSMRPNFLKNIV